MGEINGSGKPLNKEGWYKHKETGVRQYLEYTSGVGTPIIDAFIQAGFVYDDNQEEVSERPLYVADKKK